MLILIYRACLLWSAPYDGINPSPQQYRSDTPGNDVEEGDELIEQLKSDSVSSLAITPPPLTLSPTPSSSDTVSTGNQTGRASSALELEWDDIFADDDPSLSGVLNKAPPNGCVTMEVDRCSPSPAPLPLPPRHIQEMRRTATKLVHGSYVEEAEFQDDVLVYDLVAQKDTKSAILERIMAATRQVRGSISNSHRLSTPSGKTVMETVNSIMSTRRRSEDGVQEERRWSEDHGKEARRRSEDCGKEMWKIKEEREDEVKGTEIRGEPKGHRCFTNGFNPENHIIDECDDAGEEGSSSNSRVSDLPTSVNCIRPKKQQHTPRDTLMNGHSRSEPCDHLLSSLSDSKVPANDGFLSCYRELMHSLGVEPECDDVTDDISTFRRRVRAVRKKLEAEGGLSEEFVLSALRSIQDEEGEEEDVEEEEEEEEEGEEEQRRGSRKRSNRRHGAPFTGMY